MNKKTSPPKETDKVPKVKVYGQRAVKKILELRFDSVISILLDESLKNNIPKEWATELSRMAKASKPYNFVKREQLDALAKSTHHEGFLAFLREKKAVLFSEWCQKENSSNFIFVLVGIQNPHNIGAILRNAAFFGVKTVFLSDCAKISLSAMRISEGGFEHLEIIESATLPELLQYFSQHKFATVGTSSHAKVLLHQYKFKQKTAIFFGEEKDGLSSELALKLQQVVAISGTNLMESLNVSATTAIFCFEWMRQNQ